MSERNVYFDVLRGIAICGVVAIHSSGKGIGFPDESFNFNFTILWRQLWNFSVPLFLAISGYFLAKKDFQGRSDCAFFIKKQVLRVYTPYIFWSIAWLVLALLFFNKPIIHELYKVLTFQSSGPYYFIALIIQYYLLLPFLKKLATIQGVFFSMAVSLFTAAIIYYVRYFTNLSLPLIIYAGAFPTWIVFFVYGLYFGTSKRIAISNKLLIFSTLTFYSISCLESYYLYSQFHQAEHAVSAVKPSSFIYSFLIISLLFNNDGCLNSRMMKYTGEASFGIYLIHMFALIITDKFLTHLPVLETIQPLYQLTLIIATILICLLCITVCRKIFLNKHLKVIGFCEAG